MINLPTIKLPRRDSATGRAVATLLQTVVALSVVILTNDEAVKILVESYPGLLPSIPLLTGVVAFLNNWLRPEVDNY